VLSLLEISPSQRQTLVLTIQHHLHRGDGIAVGAWHAFTRRVREPTPRTDHSSRN